MADGPSKKAAKRTVAAHAYDAAFARLQTPSSPPGERVAMNTAHQTDWGTRYIHPDNPISPAGVPMCGAIGNNPIGQLVTICSKFSYRKPQFEFFVCDGFVHVILSVMGMNFEVRSPCDTNAQRKQLRRDAAKWALQQAPPLDFAARQDDHIASLPLYSPYETHDVTIISAVYELDRFLVSNSVFFFDVEWRPNFTSGQSWCVASRRVASP